MSILDTPAVNAHTITEGRRNPAQPDPNTPGEIIPSSHDIVCACGQIARGADASDALELFYVHAETGL